MQEMGTKSWLRKRFQLVAAVDLRKIGKPVRNGGVHIAQNPEKGYFLGLCTESK